MQNVNFVFQNEQAGLGGGSTVEAVPFVEAFDHQNAMQQASRQPGGASYGGPPWSVTNGAALLDDLATRFDNDGLSKHGVFHVTTTGTTPVNIDLTNLTTNATSYAGDTTFATWNKIVAWNLSGLDGVAAASMTMAPGGSNPAPLGLGGTSPTLTLPASSPVVLTNKAGGTITSSAKIITVTPSAGGNFALAVAGS